VPQTSTDPVVYQGGANHQALTALLAKAPIDDATHDPVFDAPPDNSDLMGTPITTFAWHAGKLGALPRGGHASKLALLELAPQPGARATGLTTGEAVTDAIASWVFGEREAHADAALSGVAYYVRFGTPDQPKLLEVFTTETSYTPSAAAWKSIAIGTWVTATLVEATFEQDALAANGGPFVGKAIKFCIDMKQ
jgi:hypothetical protein